MLVKGLDPTTAASTVRNLWLGARSESWVSNYRAGIYNPNLAGFQNLASWYAILMSRRSEIAGIFSQLKEQYLAQKGVSVAPALPKQVAVAGVR